MAETDSSRCKLPEEIACKPQCFPGSCPAWDLSIAALSFFFNVYFWERERASKLGRGMVRERGRHRIWSRLQAPRCQHRAQHGAWTHKPWDHDLSQSQMLSQLSYPGAPALLWFCDLYNSIPINYLFLSLSYPELLWVVYKVTLYRWYPGWSKIIIIVW